MRANGVRKIWQGGGAVINGWLAIPSGISAETMAHQGWDSLTVDQQHGMVDFASAVAMLQAISTTDTVPLTRVPWLDPGYIMKMLDAGAYGIICPMINNRAQTEALVGACRYAPQGYRSFGPARGLLYGGADYPEKANETVLSIAMIETQESLDNLDAIMSVPGLDGIYIGPSDLGLSLGGKPKPDQTDPKIRAAIESILASAKKHRLLAGIHCGTTTYARKMIDLGFQLVTIQSDNVLMAAAAKRTVAELRDGTAPGQGNNNAGSLY